MLRAACVTPASTVRAFALWLLPIIGNYKTYYDVKVGSNGIALHQLSWKPINWFKSWKEKHVHRQHGDFISLLVFLMKGKYVNIIGYDDKIRQYQYYAMYK
jgi:hypothetical protein